MLCANAEGIFRIIQAIPSPKAEPSRRWLAKGAACERLREMADPELAFLSEEIARAAFGLTPAEHKNLKGLARENLRDHMTGLEMIFSMLGEAVTTEIARKRDARGFAENKVAAGKGGGIAGEAREKLGLKLHCGQLFQ